MLERLIPDYTVPVGPFRIVYVCRRGAEVLYVGQSRTGLARPLMARHEVLYGRVQSGDVVDIYRIPDDFSLNQVETDFIRVMKPRFNKPRATQRGRTVGLKYYRTASGRRGVDRSQVRSEAVACV